MTGLVEQQYHARAYSKALTVFGRTPLLMNGQRHQCEHLHAIVQSQHHALMTENARSILERITPSDDATEPESGRV